MLKHDIRMSSPKQTVQSKQLPERGVTSALSDEGDSGNEDDGTQSNSDTSVRPVTLRERWTVVLNSLRQVVYCHLKSGIACFQMPENPELLDDLKFEEWDKLWIWQFEPETVVQIASADLAIAQSTAS